VTTIIDVQLSLDASYLKEHSNQIVT